MAVAFAHRVPTDYEVEKLRLILSTYQDGTGGERKGQLPGWRDFERAVAATFSGYAVESKGIYDVLLPDPQQEALTYGLACKMRGTLSKVDKDGRVTIEVSNALGEFWDTLKANDINEETLDQHPEQAGRILIGVVESWHEAVDVNHGGNVDSRRSSYLILQWNPSTLVYQLFQFPIDLPDASTIRWEVSGRGLRGRDARSDLLFEWYGYSGGQFKYYPLAEEAQWHSARFHLEPLPADLETGLTRKAEAYFPDAWARIQSHR